MFGYRYDVNDNLLEQLVNPATGVASCPAGYIASPIFGTTGLDYPVYSCFKILRQNEAPGFDFGGMFGWYYDHYDQSIKTFNNPKTFAPVCPDGFSTVPLLGTVGLDYDLFYCHRPHESGYEAFKGLYSFGAVGSADNLRIVHYTNPITNEPTCSTGPQAQQVFGTINLDYPIMMCYE
jgi:hypothetical protein